MLLRDESGGNLFYWPGGTRHRGGVSLIWALMLNCGNLSQRWQEKGTSREPARLTVSDALHRDGQARSSGEVAVMATERRGLVTGLPTTGQLSYRRNR